MKEEGGGLSTMLGLNPGLRDGPAPPFPGFPGFRGLPGVLGPPGPHGAPLNGPPPPPSSNPLPNMWPFIWNHISNMLPQLSIARMDPLSQNFSLRWNQHQANMLNVFGKLLQSEDFCDVTLACDGGSLKCHKIVLAASSNYFQKLFMDNCSDHPIVFLKDVKAVQIRAILDYMYKGEVSVAQEELPSLLRVAELLCVKGMIEEQRDCKDFRERKDLRDIHRPRTPDAAPPNNVAPPKTTPNGVDPLSSPGSMPTPHTPTSAPLPPPPGAGMPPNFRPFMTPPGPNSTPPFPMWPLPGLFPGAHNIFNHREMKQDVSPGPPKDRHKIPSGSSSDKEVPIPPLIPREGPESDEKASYDRHNGDHDSHNYPDPRNPYNNEKSQKNGLGYSGPHGMGKLEGIAGYVPAQRLEWKRYKQYTRNDIMAAIEEVKKGKSALQVSKKFNIPSRTLYDKVKKMGITTGRQQQRKSMNSNFNAYSSAFPGLNMMAPLNHMPDGMPMENPYKNLMDRIKEVREDDESRDSRDHAGRHDDHKMKEHHESRKDLGPMPFSILPPHMLNMMERIKSEGGGPDPRDREDTHDTETQRSSPMNLSSEKDDYNKRTSDSFPMSPSPSSGASNCQNSPSSCANTDSYERSSTTHDRYHDRDSDPRGPTSSPPPHGNHAHLDIRAQFLAGLRRLDDTGHSDSHSPESLDLATTGHHHPSKGHMNDYAHGNQDNLPPRKRKVSQDVDVDSPPGARINLPEHKVGGINGLHDVEGRENSAIVN